MPIQTAVQRDLANAELIWGFAQTLAGGPDDPEIRDWLDELEPTVAGARGVQLEQRRGIADRHAAVLARHAGRKSIRHTMLPLLIAVARSAFRKQPELDRRFRMPTARFTQRGFLRAVRAMLREAQPHRKQMEAHGMPQVYLDELAGEIAGLEQATARIGSSRRAHVRATRELRRLVHRAVNLAWQVEFELRVRHPDYEALLQQWRAARGERAVLHEKPERGALRLIS